MKRITDMDRLMAIVLALRESDQAMIQINSLADPGVSTLVQIQEAIRFGIELGVVTISGRVVALTITGRNWAEYLQEQ